MDDIKDCHYCYYASCDTATSDCECCRASFGFAFNHVVTDSSEAEECSDFEFDDTFPK